MTKVQNDFEVAKSIHDLLEPLNNDRRVRVIRWVSESLGLSHEQQPVPSAVAPMTTPSDTAVNTQGGNDTDTKTDIKSFCESKSPSTDSQFASVVAYYYKFVSPEEQRQDTINAETLQNATRLVSRSRFSNALNTLNNTKRSGYLDSPSSGEFEINTVGENLVAMTLPSDSAPARKKRPKKVSAKKKGKKKATTKKKGKKSSKKKK